MLKAAEKKMLFMAMVLIFLFVLNGITVSLRTLYAKKFEEALFEYALCGMITRKDELNHCDKDELERYSFTGLSAISAALQIVLVPAFFLIIAIKWTSVAKFVRLKAVKMTICVSLKGKNNERFEI